MRNRIVTIDKCEKLEECNHCGNIEYIHSFECTGCKEDDIIITFDSYDLERSKELVFKETCLRCGKEYSLKVLNRKKAKR